jgi:hypothetical protein
MQSKVQRWGNSLALRIPKVLRPGSRAQRRFAGGDLGHREGFGDLAASVPSLYPGTAPGRDHGRERPRRDRDGTGCWASSFLSAIVMH